MNKFGRKFQLYITLPDKSILMFENPYTCEFSIKTTDFASAAYATFRIYNLGKETRDKIFKPSFDQTVRMAIQFYGGYESNVPLIFEGMVQEAKSFRHEGSTEMITEIVAWGHGDAFCLSYSLLTIPGKTDKVWYTKKQAILMLLKDLEPFGVTVGAVSKSFENEIYVRPKILVGLTAQLIRQESGGYFFVNNGKAYVMKTNDYIPGTISVIDSSTGLLGVPALNDKFIEATLLFEPRIVVGQVIDLKSEDIPKWDGKYQVSAVMHNGVISDGVSGKCITTIHVQYNLKIQTIPTLQEVGT